MSSADRRAPDSLGALEDAEPVELAVGAVEIHAVADDPAVADFEADVVELQGDAAATGLAHQHGDAERARGTRSHERPDGLERAAFVGDVVGDDHVAVAEGADVTALEHDLAQLRAVTATRAHFQPLGRDAARLETAREPRSEAARALGDHDEQGTAAFERARELGGQRVDAHIHDAGRVQLEHAAILQVPGRQARDPIARAARRAKPVRVV